MNQRTARPQRGRLSMWLAQHRRRVTFSVLAGTLVLLVIAVLLAIAVLNSAPRLASAPSTGASASPEASAASVEPSPSSGPTVTPAPSASASATPVVAASMTPGWGSWTDVAAFGAPGTITTIRDVEAAPFGLIAVGVQYGTTQLPVFGQVARDGRVWRSEDGRSWADVTPQGTFAESDIYQVVALPDGAVVAYSRVLGLDGVEAYSAWESMDGRTWYGSEISLGSQPVLNMTAGGPGYVTVRRVSEGPAELWFSSSGRDFQYAAELPPSTTVASLAGGPEGFVAVLLSSDDTPVVTILASGDGRQWFEADAAPQDMRAALPLAGDWIGIAPAPPFDVYLDATTTTWFSSNGIGWSQLGSLQFRAVGPEGPTACREFLSDAISAGDLVIVSTLFSYPCSEGGVQRFGQSSVSAEGDEWVGLPFTSSELVATDSSRGATVTDGIEFNDLVVLVGERDHHATIWVNDAD